MVNDGELDSDPASVLITTMAATGTTPVIFDLTTNESGVRLLWSALQGRTYRVRYKDALDAVVWTNASGDPTGIGTQLEWVDTTAIGVSRRFYSIEMLDP